MYQESPLDGGSIESTSQTVPVDNPLVVRSRGGGRRPIAGTSPPERDQIQVGRLSRHDATNLIRLDYTAGPPAPTRRPRYRVPRKSPARSPPTSRGRLREDRSHDGVRVTHQTPAGLNHTDGLQIQVRSSPEALDIVRCEPLTSDSSSILRSRDHHSGGKLMRDELLSSYDHRHSVHQASEFLQWM